MLKPAILYKDEILKKMSEKLYSDELFYYIGYEHGHELPDLTPRDNVYQYAIVDSNNELLGYFSYVIEFDDTVDKFGLIALSDRRSYTLGHDVYKEMERLIKQHRRIEWRMIGGNKVFKHYYNLCTSYGGYAHRLHSVIKSRWGYLDEWIFEIVHGSPFKAALRIENEEKLMELAKSGLLTSAHNEPKLESE